MNVLALIETAIEQLSPTTVFVTLCAAVSALFGVLLLLFKHMLDNDRRKTEILEGQHKLLSEWLSKSDGKLDRILERVAGRQ